MPWEGSMASGAQFGGPPPTTPAGDAGNNFLSNLLDVPLDTEGAKRVNEGAQQFKTLAESGGFTINEAGFEHYRKVCDTFIDGYNSIRRDLHVLSLAAQMGGSDYAKQVASFNVKVAVSDHESLVPNLELLSEGFKQVREALEIARKNYRETEDAHSQTFAKLRGSE
ncbi:hypothetical protein GCM10017567_73130 [Amycolatopsis bullii]|uniref:PE domain-containing protein n=1 Tax=Amycolatopsis bullii TaxID=941987 RepID=A0ABQ3KS49_9PSEU|nr:hypothetical protein GCM10017567_73130 [Amycolatopsis bullii]